MTLLTRDAILTADDLKTQDVEVDAWGGTVRLRMLTGTERDAFEAETVQMRGKKQHVNLEDFRARLVSRCIVDETGKRVFSDRDVKALGAKSAAALSLLFNAAQDMNGLSAGDVEDLTEGFDDAPSESSTSG